MDKADINQKNSIVEEIHTDFPKISKFDIDKEITKYLKKQEIQIKGINTEKFEKYLRTKSHKRVTYFFPILGINFTDQEDLEMEIEHEAVSGNGFQSKGQKIENEGKWIINKELTLYNRDHLKKELSKKGISLGAGSDLYFGDFEYILVVKLKGFDGDFLYEEAVEKGKIFIDFLNSMADIEAPNYKLIQEMDYDEGAKIYGRVHIINNRVLKEEGFSPLTYFEKVNPKVYDLISIFDSKNHNDIERQVTAAAKWLGESKLDVMGDIDTAFLKAMIALECLLETRYNHTLTITGQVSIMSAIITGEDTAEREEIRNTVKRYYRKRSNLVHGEVNKKGKKNKKNNQGSKIDYDDYEYLFNLVQKVMYRLMTDERYSSLNEVDDVWNKIEKEMLAKVQ